MKYMGSKSRIAKYIVPILQSEINKNGIKEYIEPFCGGCNVIDKIKCDKKVANDLNKFLIALFIHLKNNGELPSEVSRELYNKVKKDYVLGAQTLGANARQIFIYVIFPAVLPDIFTGLRTSLGVEYTTLVAAEMVAAVSGIGWMVLDASNYLRSDIMFFGIILMGITGIVLDQILKLVEHYMVHWKGKN